MGQYLNAGWTQCRSLRDNEKREEYDRQGKGPVRRPPETGPEIEEVHRKRLIRSAAPGFRQPELPGRVCRTALPAAHHRRVAAVLQGSPALAAQEIFHEGLMGFVNIKMVLGHTVCGPGISTGISNRSEAAALRFSCAELFHVERVIISATRNEAIKSDQR